MEFFHRGSSVVQWCEDVLENDKNALIAEPLNTVTNLSYILAGTYGLYRCQVHKLPLAQVLAEVTIICIGIGSTFFHAHQSRVAQISDELPMSLLAGLYVHSLWESNPKPAITALYNSSRALVAVFWLAYICSGIYEVFLFCFGCQLCFALCLAREAGILFQLPRRKWYTMLGLLIGSLGVWKLERHRYLHGNCDALGTILLHPIWHIGTSLSHFFACSYNKDVILAKRKVDENRNSTNKIVNLT